MSQEILLDVREMPPRERHPRIFDAWEQLPVGHAIKLINDHDPKPLFYEFQAERRGEFSWTPIERGPQNWIVEIRRVAAAANGPGQKQVLSERPAWVEQIPCGVVDVREDLRLGREPFQKIMTAAMQVRPGEVFVLRAIFEPQPLYKALANKGFQGWPERVSEGDWKIYFRRKPEKSCGCGGKCHGE